ncbi:DUF4198 domain-containing protein [Chitinophaga lutea]
MLNKLLLCCACLLAFATGASAHALWVETSPSGKKGQAQEVRVYWGEYADKDISPLDKWFSDTKAYTLFVVTPDNKKIPLASTPGKDHYKAYFTPESDGVYTVVMQHSVKDVYHGSRLDYHASAQVTVGKGAAAANANSNAISVEAPARAKYGVNQQISLKSVLSGKPTSGEVEVIAPNGWIRKLWADSTGIVNFTPLWPGRYMVEVARTDKTPGSHQGKNFDAIWRCATYCIEVK